MSGVRGYDSVWVESALWWHELYVWEYRYASLARCAMPLHGGLTETELLASYVNEGSPRQAWQQLLIFDIFPHPRSSLRIRNSP